MFNYPLSSLLTVIFTWAAVALSSLFDTSRLGINYIEYAMHGVVLLLTLLVINESTYFGYKIRYYFLTLLASTIFSLMFVSPLAIALIYSVMFCSIFAFYAPVTLCYIYILFIHGLFLVCHALYWQTGWQWSHAGMFMAFHFFALVMTQRMISERSAKEALALTNAKLEATQQLLGSAAAQNERLRLARDLHDEMGHSLTSLIINLDIARRTCSDEQKTQIQACYEQAKQALGTTRIIVSDNRDDIGFDLVTCLIQLAKQTPRLVVNIDITQTIDHVPIDISQCILKCTQEAITNTLKHAPTASEINIALHRNNSDLLLTITDNGQVKGHINFGNGLTGMQERVTQVKGRLSIDKTIQGLKITIRVPYE
ncbi:hypothetical protein PSECIP111951_02514 [Pseudoalteromonas holothuriae]|uniref:Signal transduction histidine kinase subgroup 3 dimerisation and phosphoacceptor domain-containing protein n=1 Tax=Pseudoalteromonas holothuriae TaxID=2963714 RepID=A0A9W4QU16_9GAMM|nr:MULTISPECIES: histidine kinase [unclassified Pseudoalteromonas]CAH9053222.1 hypothetical protein PSECIP111854_01128 [Pseudoalteromonas sp. CIP111854]CAH9061559.1 hypothetical protein PSECIP111951_02514 [Pseudoalteromonas sp. CIP111951]